MKTPAYISLNNAWKKTCSVVFGEDVGELDAYEPWLAEFTMPGIHRKSSVSNRDVTYAVTEYDEKSKWISFDEVESNRKFKPLDINEIKDIDSIREAIADTAYYAGNIVLGNSGQVERSSSINDSFYMRDTMLLGDSKYLDHCFIGRVDEYCFGSYAIGETSFCIRCAQTYRDKRSFELWMSWNCSDCYYVYNVHNCTNCLFSFNVKNKRNCIGNLELNKDKYEQTKKKLLAELADELRQKKRLPSLLDIVNRSKYEKPQLAEVKAAAEGSAKKIIETEFSKTSGIILGKKLAGIDDYADWLTRHTHKIQEGTSAISGRKIPIVPFIIAKQDLPRERLITLEEAEQLGEHTKLSQQDAEGISLRNAHEKIGKLAFFNVELRTGVNKNLEECTMAADALNCYRASATVYAKYCAYGMWPRSSEYCFGFDRLFDSNFCIKCYHSVKLSRCFELDASRNCSDSYFSHNCENIHDSMFCFNTKNLNHAIGNTTLAPDDYKKIKLIIMQQIWDELDGKKNLKWNIYNIGVRP
ncbi:MAG: hypothetical protein V1492_06215 [Candidatus Micrarchaeota archaeon]